MKKVSRYIILIFAIIIMVTVTVYSFFMIKDTISTPNQRIKDECNVETAEFIKRKIYTITPKEGATNNKVICYIHGGSYMGEMTDDHWNFISQLVNDTGSTVIIPDYPLTPRYNYKNVFNMMSPLYKEIVSKMNTDDLIMMGDSAGGGLALALEEKMAEENYNLPSKTILISPWLDISMSNPKINEVQLNDTDLNKETLILAGVAYAGEGNDKDYLVSPLYGDTSKIRNITIFTGTYDILNPDVHVLKEKNESIEIKEYEKAKHVWLLKINNDELAIQAYNDLLEILKN